MLRLRLDIFDANPWQPRTIVDETHIADLAASIARDGLLQTPLGRIVNQQGVVVPAAKIGTQPGVSIPANKWRVQLAFGHSRLKAYELLSGTDPSFGAMPVDLRNLTDEQMANFAWSENAQRKDLTAIEEAEAIAKRLNDFGWTHAQAAEAMGLERSVISNKLRLLRLPEATQA